MKKVLTMILLLTINATAAMSELASYNDLDLSLIDQDTLVVFDIDNTLIRQNSLIGTHQWGDHMRSRAIENGISAEKAAEIQHAAFQSVQPYVQVVKVEEDVDAILKHLQKNHISHFALTARAPVLKEVTFKQLESVNLFFNKSFPEQNNLSLIRDYFYKGLIFSGSTPKGEILKTILQNSVYKYKKIIFIDDRKYNLDSIESSLKDEPVVLLTYRYGAADNFVQSFNPELADLIYSFFLETKTLMSDSTAAVIQNSLDQIANLRFEFFLSQSGPLVEKIKILLSSENGKLQGAKAPFSAYFLFFQNQLYCY